MHTQRIHSIVAGTFLDNKHTPRPAAEHNITMSYNNCNIMISVLAKRFEVTLNTRVTHF